MLNIKKLIVILLILAVIVTLLAPVLADDDGEPEITEVEITLNNAGFHCNTFGGNGSVDPAGYSKGDIVTFERIDETTWKLRGSDYVCPECGSTEWVSYSNKSGVPDGKNIQIHHPKTTPVDEPPPVDETPVFNLLVKKESSHELSEDFRIKVYKEEGGVKGALVATLEVGNSGGSWYYFTCDDQNVHYWIITNLHEGDYIIEESGHMTSSGGLSLDVQNSKQTGSITLSKDASNPRNMPKSAGGVSKYHGLVELINKYDDGGDGDHCKHCKHCKHCEDDDDCEDGKHCKHCKYGKDCKDDEDDEDCKHCKHCKDGKDGEGCKHCKDIKNCKDCKDGKHCKDCKDGKDGKYCKHCKRSKHCEHCKHCEDCDDGEDCKHCKHCKDCEQTPLTGDITVTVTKKLPEGVEDSETEFAFSLSLWVGEDAYEGVTPDEQKIKAGATATWGPYTFDAGAVVKYELTEVETTGYKWDSTDIMIGETPAEGDSVEIVAGKNITIEYTVTNKVDVPGDDPGGGPGDGPDDTLPLELTAYKSFRLGGAATSVTAGTAFNFKLIDDEGNTAASGTLTTVGNEEAGEGKNYAVTLSAAADYVFEPEQIFTLREEKGTATGWTYDENAYKVGYAESDDDGETHGVLYYIVDVGVPEGNGGAGIPGNYIEVDEALCPVFVNRYTRSGGGSGGGGTTSRTTTTPTSETGTDIPDTQTPLVERPDTPDDAGDGDPATPDAGPADEPADLAIPELPVPLARMPQTGVADSTAALWARGLCLSIFGLVAMLCAIKRERKKTMRA